MNKNDAKRQIIKKFEESVKGKKQEITKGANSKHNGAKGHHLEELFNIKHNAGNNPDLLGFEMKDDTQSRMSFGDWSANYYIFNDPDYFNVFNDKNKKDRKNKFCRIFGSYKESSKRFSWSGTSAPKYEKYNEVGQKMIIDDLDIKVIYNFQEDRRKDKGNIVPTIFQKNYLEIAIWFGYEFEKCKKYSGKPMKNKINDKFNNYGFFIVKTDKDGYYSDIVFGDPIDYNKFLNLIREGVIFFDPGMYDGNNVRMYQQWRINNSQIVDILAKN